MKNSLIIILLFLCGCGPAITCGHVVKKEYKEAYSYQDISFMDIGDVKVPVFEEIDVPEQFIITIKHVPDEPNPQPIYRSFDVDKNVFDKYNNGDFFEVNR